MKQIYSFDAFTPPRIIEAGLQEELKRRTLKRQILALRIASLLSCLCMAIFAFFIMRDSMIVAAASIVMMTLTLIGSGMIQLVFHKFGMSDHQ